MSGKELKLISPFGAYSLSQLLGIKISVFNLVTAVDNSILVGLYKLFHSLMIISGLILEVTDSLSQIHACIGVGIKPGCLFVNTPLQAGKLCRNKAQTGMSGQHPVPRRKLLLIGGVLLVQVHVVARVAGEVVAVTGHRHLVKRQPAVPRLSQMGDQRDLLPDQIVEDRIQVGEIGRASRRERE